MGVRAYEFRFAGEADRTVRAAFSDFNISVGDGSTEAGTSAKASLQGRFLYAASSCDMTGKTGFCCPGAIALRALSGV